MNTERHVLVNALAMGGGGGLTVGREVIRNIALARKHWKITAVLVSENSLHEQMRSASLPGNCDLLWAPPRTIGRADRSRWERSELSRWADEHRVDAVVQLNGMLVPTMRPPTLCHMQDPWPYRPQAWTTFKERVIAMLKRRAHRKTLRRASAFTWTSDYLRRLICKYHNIWPTRSEVVYNGVPDSWIERARGGLPPWVSRPNELVTVSNIGPYKRHSVVIQAIPLLMKRPGLSDIVYRIVGAAEPGMQEKLSALAVSLGVADRVRFEGRVSDADLAQVYSRARCFVMMSVCESFGIPAIEAMSFGTPVVTADCCAMPEICGDAAELSPVDDVNALVDRIAHVMLSPERAEEMRRLGAQQASRFSWTMIGEHMAGMLDQIIGGG